MKFMDRLPTVISCCFCCFLRSGTVMIAMFSFLIGLMFAPNVSYTNGFWGIGVIQDSYSAATESFVQMTLGIVSVMLCTVSILLLLGTCCNIPLLIEVYQWGAIIYSLTVFILFIIQTSLCFFIQTNCSVAGSFLCVMTFVDLFLTLYFVIVTNSLRISLKFMERDEFDIEAV